MKLKLALLKLSLATALLLVGLPRLGLAQGTSELEQLKSIVKAMEQTIQEQNRRIEQLEKQAKAAPPPVQPATVEPVTPGVPPPTHPGADVKPKAQAPADELADATTQIPYQDSMKEEDLVAPRPGNAPLDPSYQGFMQLFGTKTWVKLGPYVEFESRRRNEPDYYIQVRRLAAQCIAWREEHPPDAQITWVVGAVALCRHPLTEPAVRPCTTKRWAR